MSHASVEVSEHVIRRTVTRVGVRTERKAVVLDAPSRRVVRQQEVVRTVVRHTGPRGRDGGEATPIELVSFEPITKGQAIRVRATGGTASPALADAIGTADVFGFATNSVGPDATVEVTRDRITLDDWTALTGAASLVRGTRYFLSQTIPGGITNSPNLLLSGACAVVVGEAISTTTLAIRITDPIRL
jgi:hypothetical protein